MINDKNYLKINLLNILKSKKEKLKGLQEVDVEYLILKEEISEIQYILYDNCSSKAIEQVKYSTTSDSIYNLLSDITKE